MDKFENLMKDINTKLEEFNVNTKKATNKSAARRARKNTIELEKLFKDYRKLSAK